MRQWIDLGHKNKSGWLEETGQRCSSEVAALEEPDSSVTGCGRGDTAASSTYKRKRVVELDRAERKGMLSNNSSASTSLCDNFARTARGLKSAAGENLQRVHLKVNFLEVVGKQKKVEDHLGDSKPV